jgi:hypothetical protein
MAPLTPPECLGKARKLFSNAHGYEPTDEQLIDWLSNPGSYAWAESAIRLGWTFPAAESVIRSIRILRKRALTALHADA